MKEGKQPLKLDYNSSYISVNLLDELDYIIGGYGKASLTSVFSLNTFIESFILNEQFYISDLEFKHMQLTSRPFFPNGRPVFDLLANEECLSVISGIGTPVAKSVYVEKVDKQNPEEVYKAVEGFQDTLAAEGKATYLVLPKSDQTRYNIKYLSLGGVKDGIIVGEHSSSPEAIVKRLYEALGNTNVQTTLPMYTYPFQISELNKQGISKEILWKLSDAFSQKQNELSHYLGFDYQPIPPLVPILFSQCKTMADIPEKLLQLRHDFRDLRSSILKFEKQINEAESIKEQFEAIKEIDEFWKVFNSKYKEKSSRLLYRFWDVAKESGYEKAVDTAIDNYTTSEIIKDLNIGKIAGKTLAKVYDWYKEKRVLNRFKGVTNIWDLFQDAPNLRQQIVEVERIFNITIDTTELTTLNQQLGDMKQHLSNPGKS